MGCFDLSFLTRFFLPAAGAAIFLPTSLSIGVFPAVKEGNLAGDGMSLSFSPYVSYCPLASSKEVC